MNKFKWHKIDGELGEEDFVRQIVVEGKKLCLIKYLNDYFAVQNYCPHAGGVLSGGWCENGHIICPIHRWEYNLHTGRGAEGQGDYINTYPVELRTDGLYIGLKENWIKRIFGS